MKDNTQSAMSPPRRRSRSVATATVGGRMVELDIHGRVSVTSVGADSSAGRGMGLFEGDVLLTPDHEGIVALESGHHYTVKPLNTVLHERKPQLRLLLMAAVLLTSMAVLVHYNQRMTTVNPSKSPRGHPAIPMFRHATKPVTVPTTLETSKANPSPSNPGKRREQPFVLAVTAEENATLGARSGPVMSISVERMGPLNRLPRASAVLGTLEEKLPMPLPSSFSASQFVEKPAILLQDPLSDAELQQRLHGNPTDANSLIELGRRRVISDPRSAISLLGRYARLHGVDSKGCGGAMNQAYSHLAAYEKGDLDWMGKVRTLDCLSFHLHVITCPEPPGKVPISISIFLDGYAAVPVGWRVLLCSV